MEVGPSSVYPTAFLQLLQPAVPHSRAPSSHLYISPSFAPFLQTPNKIKNISKIEKSMAVVRQRRQLNLRLPLPEVSERCPRFPLPLPPTAAGNATANNTGTIALSDLDKLQVLGHGNGGTVYKVRHKRTEKLFALKVVHGDTDPIVRRQVFREMEILRRTDSPYIVQCHGIYEKPYGDIAILMEYMDYGALDTLLKKTGTFSESELAQVTSQILKGLSYLHAHKIIHRDIKPSNLLVNKTMQVKISDFGVSKIMCRTLDACNSYVGTCAYMSPERFDPDTYGGNYNGYAGDIWSLGLTLLELYLGHFPFLQPGQRPDWATLMCAICFGDPPSVPDGVSDEFRSFIECCLQKDSSKRWSASQLLTHPFVCKHSRCDC
ncbi:Mitogen-activated protein kinase [Melia azedarach]|uniref:Mitogen-activated protein kinase n=1 Tax=Melia azedarach TaxID=155640 RepID=A0ACC1XS69_MELAZ|nr:Mitogen-activated protein kinase [Melia azedarach]